MIGRMSLFVVVLLLNPLSTAVAAENNSGEIPKVILSGFEAYKADGPEAAVKAWLKGGPIEGNKDALTQANILRSVQDYYGPIKSFHVIRTKDLGPSSRLTFLVFDYEKGPVFARFLTFQADQGWIVVSFDFNTKPERIIPEI